MRFGCHQQFFKFPPSLPPSLIQVSLEWLQKRGWPEENGVTFEYLVTAPLTISVLAGILGPKGTINNSIISSSSALCSL